MRGALLWLCGAGWLLSTLILPARPSAHAHAAADSGRAFPVGELTFSVPLTWKIEMVDSPARGGQWRVPSLKPGGEQGQVVAFYFGPKVGGSAKQNIEAWIGTMVNAEGHPAAAEIKHREPAGFHLSQVVIFGTYNQMISMPGIPPEPRPNFGLVGAVIEHPQGNIYWRLTGPEGLVTATLPAFNQVLDSVRVTPVK